MAVKLMERYPPAGAWRAAGRGLGSAIGIVLIPVGILIFVATGIWAVAVTLDPDPRRGGVGDWVGLVSALAVAVLAVTGGLRLVRGRRRLGLFLRRFGFGPATATISRTLAGPVGRSWRMVTLDDAEIRAIGAARRHTLLLAPLATLSMLAVAAIMTVGGSLIAGDPWNLVQSDTGEGGIGEAIGQAMVVLLLGLLLLMLLPLAVIFGAAFLATRRARRRASVHVMDEGVIASTAVQVRKRSRRVFAPRLVVARVSDRHWRSTVRAFASVCDAVVIDVSQASEHLVWELHAMRAFHGDRWVPVCHRDRAATLMDHGVEGTPQHEIARLLDGQEVLVYGDGSRHRRQFARALRSRLALTVRVRAATEHTLQDDQFD